MRSSHVRKFTVVLLGALACWSVSPGAHATPKISSPEAIFNFGEVDNSGDVIHDFVIKNEGDTPLSIQNVKTSCGCTVAELKKKVLEPAEETTVSAKFSLKGKTGQQTKIITVESDDPANPQFALQLQGTAIAAVMLEPNLVNFGRVVGDEVNERVVDIKIMKDDISFNITGVESPSDKLTTEIKTIEAGKHFQLAVRTNAGIGEGSLTSKITLLTDNPKHASFQLSVFGNVIGALEVSPPQISLRYSAEAGKTSSQYIRVTPGSVKEFEITEVIVPVPAMTATIKPRSANDYLIYLQNMPQNDELDGKELLIKTNVETSPVLKIPFKVIKAGAAAAGRNPVPQLKEPLKIAPFPKIAPTAPAQPAPAPAPVDGQQ
ncbi:MAG: DUF1573 domain-containing protein [Candidatus Hydrogenedentes bacterium]|nr:DUF1573 domain-containing protein [Candidatus Hydrogenedentota bacterium]